jgi:hypothetical protein
LLSFFRVVFLTSSSNACRPIELNRRSYLSVIYCLFRVDLVAQCSLPACADVAEAWRDFGPVLSLILRSSFIKSPASAICCSKSTSPPAARLNCLMFMYVFAGRKATARRRACHCSALPCTAGCCCCCTMKISTPQSFQIDFRETAGRRIREDGRDRRLIGRRAAHVQDG